ncbi:hypothetical protein F2Q68_00032164 [Brassica cretica]|uniref:Uncharacterized protein n=1 Tax=Brassica cretica TaxID=69181 RepID=A0A8S9GCV0_BRACR|nr:hypothetical protein F2Q68_00032164 [Brassica cretica]
MNPFLFKLFGKKWNRLLGFWQKERRFLSPNDPPSPAIEDRSLGSDEEQRRLLHSLFTSLIRGSLLLLFLATATSDLVSTYTDLLALSVAYTRVERMSKINSMVLRGESPDQGNRDLHRQSPPRKVQTDVAYGRNKRYGTNKESRGFESNQTNRSHNHEHSYQRNKYNSESSRHGVWSRLDKEYPIPRVIRRDESAGIRSNTQHMSREQRQDYIPHADITRGKGENISREFNGSRQQEWRPKVSQSYTSDRTRDSHKDRVFVPREMNCSTLMSTGVDQDDTDSQRTISEHPRIFTNNGTQGSGHLVVHRNETEEEKRRRLKGKAIMAPLDATPMSKAKDATSSTILIGRNTIIIGDQPSFRPTSQRALIGQTAESAQGRQNASSERATIIDTATREEGILDDDMLTEEQAKQVTMTAEDEAEVDRLVSEFGDVIMDENMMENDDLLVDEPGFDAEKIDAISQLSPMQSPMQVQKEPDEEMGPKNPSSHRHEKAQRAEHENKKHVASAQPMLEVPLDMIVTDKGVAKKKPASSAVVKGARASKKLAAQRGRASPKKARGSGIPKKSASHKVPRIEVLEYHMKFLETFECIWSSREVIRVIFGRALPGATSRSDYMKSL